MSNMKKFIAAEDEAHERVMMAIAAFGRAIVAPGVEVKITPEAAVEITAAREAVRTAQAAYDTLAKSHDRLLQPGV